MNGNVGVGTWSPTSRVQIIGTVAATAFVGDGSGLTGISANSGWTDGGTNVYTSTITDNVGIGTTTPTVRLHVPWISGDTTTTAYFGALNMSDNQTAVVAQSGTGGGVFGESVTYIGVNGYSNSSSGIRGESASGYGVEGASDSSSSGFFRARLSGNATATLLTKQNGAGTADLFQAQNDTGTSLVNISSAGNVGIGTPSPTQLLNIRGSTTSNTELSVLRLETVNTAGLGDTGLATGIEYAVESDSDVVRVLGTQVLHLMDGDDGEETADMSFSLTLNGNTREVVRFTSGGLDVTGIFLNHKTDAFLTGTNTCCTITGAR